MGNQLPLKRGDTAAPPLAAHAYCGQTVGWIKMPFGTEVDLGPGDVVLDGDPALPTERDTTAPTTFFGPCLWWPNGWMDQDATWHRGKPQPKRHCIRWRPSYTHGKGHSSPHRLFGPCLSWPNGRPSQQLLSSCKLCDKSVLDPITFEILHSRPRYSEICH